MKIETLKRKYKIDMLLNNGSLESYEKDAYKHLMNISVLQYLDFLFSNFRQNHLGEIERQYAYRYNSETKILWLSELISNDFTKKFNEHHIKTIKFVISCYLEDKYNIEIVDELLKNLE